MNIETIPNKSLYKMAVNFIKKHGDGINDLYDSYLNDKTDFGVEMTEFLKSLGFSDSSEEYFYMFLKLNYENIVDGSLTNYTILKRPVLKTYSFIWETRQIQTVGVDYKHTYNTYLDEDQAYSAIEVMRYNGEIYPGDGEEIKYELYDSDMDEESIEKFKEVKKRK
jgi:Ni,Fe-hydrogenase I large subunit